MKKWIRFTIIIVTLLIIFFILRNFASQLFSNLNLLKNIILSLGIFSPILIIILQIIQGMTSLFPDSAIIIVSGYIYGPLLGIIYNTIGELTAALAFYFIAKKYGCKLIIFNEKRTKNFKKIIKNKGKYAILFFRIIPVFPNNVINFTAGWAKMDLKEVIIMNVLAIIPYTAAFAFFGEYLEKIIYDTRFLIAVLFLFSITIILYLFIEEKYKKTEKSKMVKNNQKKIKK